MAVLNSWAPANLIPRVTLNKAKIESGPNYITAMHAFVIATLR